MTTASTSPDANNSSRPFEHQELIIDSNYQIFIIALMVLQLINSLLIVLRPEPQRSVMVLFFVFLSFVLIADAVHRILRLGRLRLLKYNKQSWLVLLGSLPIPFLILVRLAATYSVFRSLQSSDFIAMGHIVIEKRAQSTLLIAVFAAVVILEMGSSLVLGAEAKSSSANIVNANDAIWWSLVTVATVGYGDQYPVTTEGRIIGVMIMIVGVGMFSVLTSYFAQWFLRADSGKSEPAVVAGVTHAEYESLMSRLEALTARVEHLTAAQPDARDGADAPPVEPDT